MPPMRRFAITYTVRNEANLLPDAIAYHSLLGCVRFYVFFDGSTDGSRQLIEGLERVVCVDCALPSSMADLPEWIRAILPRWQDSMDVRKRINTFMAAGWAKQEGIEWLINIDPDELLLLGTRAEDAPGDCEQFFASVPSGIDQILVPNLETVPVGAGSGRPFVDCTLFLNRFPTTELLWKGVARVVRALTADPKTHAWFDHWFYRARFTGALPRRMRHPTTGESIPAGYFLGYSNHKAFIRAGVAEEFMFNIHRWQKVRRTPRSIKRGRLLHYDLCSAEYFCAKFTQRQPGMLVKAFYTRYLFARIARELPFSTVRRFFLDQICIRDPRVLARLKARGIIAEIGCIAALLRDRPVRSSAPAESLLAPLSHPS